MANNRLFVGNKATKEYVMISKGFGSGWKGVSNIEKFEKLIVDCISESEIRGQTRLFFFTEYSPCYKAIIDKWRAV